MHQAAPVAPAERPSRPDPRTRPEAHPDPSSRRSLDWQGPAAAHAAPAVPVERILPVALVGPAVHRAVPAVLRSHSPSDHAAPAAPAERTLPAAPAALRSHPPSAHAAPAAPAEQNPPAGLEEHPDPQDGHHPPP